MCQTCFCLFSVKFGMHIFFTNDVRHTCTDLNLTCWSLHVAYRQICIIADFMNLNMLHFM